MIVTGIDFASKSDKTAMCKLKLTGSYKAPLPHDVNLKFLGFDIIG